MKTYLTIVSYLSDRSTSIYSQLSTSYIVCFITSQETASIPNITWLAKPSKWNDASHFCTRLFIIRHASSRNNRRHPTDQPRYDRNLQSSISKGRCNRIDSDIIFSPLGSQCSGCLQVRNGEIEDEHWRRLLSLRRTIRLQGEVVDLRNLRY